MDFSSLFSLMQVAFPGFTETALQALAAAQQQATRRKHWQVTPEHFLLALASIRPGPGRVTLERLGVDLKQDITQVEALVDAIPQADCGEKHQCFSPKMEQVLAE